MKAVFTLVILFSSLISSAQVAQINTLKPDTFYESINSLRLFSDKHVTSFLIHIKREVKAHRHLLHSEHVYVVSGKGEMMLGADKFKIKAGQLIFIPENTVHSVKTISRKPLKIISIQAPEFDGTDRVFVN